MEKAPERIFKKGEYVYVVDYWGTEHGTQAFEEEAKILYVEEEKQTFTALLYGDSYNTYSFKDYGRLIFDSRSEAIKAANSLPKPQSIVYVLINNKIYQRKVAGIKGFHENGMFDLYIRFGKEKFVSIREMGHSIFFTKEDALKHKN